MLTRCRQVKAIEGLGTTIDTIIVNGKLKENDRMVVCTMDGPVITHIRALLTPPPSRELRIKSEYIHHKEVSYSYFMYWFFICASCALSIVVDVHTYMRFFTRVHMSGLCQNCLPEHSLQLLLQLLIMCSGTMLSC